jgi:hypothetical protein
MADKDKCRFEAWKSMDFTTRQGGDQIGDAEIAETSTRRRNIGTVTLGLMICIPPKIQQTTRHLKRSRGEGQRVQRCFLNASG